MKAVAFASALLLMPAIPGQKPDLQKFNVSWRPEADAPFSAIRKQVEPFAVSRSTTYPWVKSKAIAAYKEWGKAPSSAKAWYRSFLWERVLFTAHYNDVTPEDEKRIGQLKRAIIGWKNIPASFEFSRLVVSALAEQELGPLANRVLTRTPDDGLFVCWGMRNFFYSLQTTSTARQVQAAAAAFYAKHPHLWTARLAWAYSPWLITSSSTIEDQLGMFREVQHRFLVLKTKHKLGPRETSATDRSLEQMGRFIKGAEKLVKEGKGKERVIGFRG